MTLGALLEGLDFQLSSGGLCFSYRAVGGLSVIDWNKAGRRDGRESSKALSG